MPEILRMLSKRCRSSSEAGRKGTIRRAMSTPLVKAENAIEPATVAVEARSMATAPPSDQPPTTIRSGWIPRVRTR